jgi:hypothetical protein
MFEGSNLKQLTFIAATLAIETEPEKLRELARQLLATLDRTEAERNRLGDTLRFSA